MKCSIMVPLSISSVSCGFGHIYWRNPYWKTSFFVQWHSSFIAIPSNIIKQIDKILGTHVRLPLKLLQSHWICSFFLFFVYFQVQKDIQSSFSKNDLSAHYALHATTKSDTLNACNFIKKRLQHRCFPVNIGNFLRAAFSIEHFSCQAALILAQS